MPLFVTTKTTRPRTFLSGTAPSKRESRNRSRLSPPVHDQLLVANLDGVARSGDEPPTSTTVTAIARIRFRPAAVIPSF